MIEARGLTKKYGRETAVDGITFSIGRGEIVGLLGPNGAGKTTTMRMLTAYLPPTAGTATIAGHDVVSGSLEARKCVGYLPETTPLYADMSVLEYLRFIGSLRGLAGKNLDDAIDRVSILCGLRGVLGKDASELSKGFRQRAGIAQAIIHDPDIVILDEPHSGLDPLQIIDVRRLVTTLGQNKVVIISTHILSEVQDICTRFMIIDAGRIVADGSLADLRRLHPLPDCRTTTLEDIFMRVAKARS